MFVAVLCLSLGLLQTASADTKRLEEVFAWKVVDFAYDKPETREADIASKVFEPENNLPLGLDVWKDKLFITVPRWKSGVPSTLNYVSISDLGPPSLDDSDDPSNETPEDEEEPEEEPDESTEDLEEPAESEEEPEQPTEVDEELDESTEDIEEPEEGEEPEDEEPEEPEEGEEPEDEEPEDPEEVSGEPTDEDSPTDAVGSELEDSPELRNIYRRRLALQSFREPLVEFKRNSTGRASKSNKKNPKKKKSSKDKNKKQKQEDKKKKKKKKCKECRPSRNSTIPRPPAGNGVISIIHVPISVVTNPAPQDPAPPVIVMPEPEPPAPPRPPRPDLPQPFPEIPQPFPDLPQDIPELPQPFPLIPQPDEDGPLAFPAGPMPDLEPVPVPVQDGTLPFPVIQLPPNTNRKAPSLIPYPSWNANKLPGTEKVSADELKITSVFRVRVDPCDRLWVMDTGLADILGAAKVNSPPRILVFDLNTDKLLRSYEFKPSDSTERSFFANIIVDVTKDTCDKAFAYVPDLGGYGVVIYDWSKNESRRITHHYFHFDPLAGDYTTAGVNYQWTDGIFSIALAKPRPDGFRTAFFHAFSSTKEFQVDTKVWKTPDDASYFSYKLAGDRGEKSQSSASFIHEDTGVMFYTQVQKDSVNCWNTNKPLVAANIQEVASSNETMVFPNDLKVDYNDNLWILTDKLPIYVYKRLDAGDVNFRIFRTKVADAIKGTSCAA